MFDLFANPWVLWLAPAVAGVWLAIGCSGWRRRRACARLGDASALTRLMRVRRKSRRLTGIALALGLAALWLGVAGPQWGQQHKVQTRSRADLVLVLDVSRSMLAEQPSRLERALRALRGLTDHFEQTGGPRVALIVFAARPQLVFPLTVDYDHLRFELDQIEARDLPAGVRPTGDAHSGTRIGAALELAVNAAGESPASILLLSDGDDPARDLEWQRGVAAARAAHIPVDTVGFGDPAATHPILIDGDIVTHAGKTVRSKLEEEPLRDIARLTQGQYIPVRTQDLALGGVVDQLLRFRVLRYRAREPRIRTSDLPLPRQHGVWFFAAALLLFAVSLLVRQHPRRASWPALLSVFRINRRTTTASHRPASHRSAATRVVMSGVALAALLLISAEAREFLQQGNDAFRRGDYDQALTWYQQAATSTPDPGRVAYNQAVTCYQLDRYADAEQFYLRCLDDDSIPPARKAQALFGLGNALLRQTGHGGDDLARLTRAIDAYENCQALPGLSSPLATDVRVNLELAKLMHLQAVQRPPDKKPPPNTPGQKDDSKKNNKEADPKNKENSKEKTPVENPGKGEPNGTKTTNSANEKKGDKTGVGVLKVLADEARLRPLTKTAARAYLEAVAARLQRERRSYVESTHKTPPHVKDW